jgi:hypothetical protein
LAAARTDGRLLDVEAALLACERRVPRDELLPGERQTLLEASGWLQLERRHDTHWDALPIALMRGTQELLEFALSERRAVWVSYFVVGGAFILVGALLMRARHSSQKDSQ